MLDSQFAQILDKGTVDGICVGTRESRT
jgi:hypothetical protein